MAIHRPKITNNYSHLIHIFSSYLSQQIHTTTNHPTKPKTLIDLIKSATESKNLKLGKSIHTHLIKFSEFNVIQYNHLMNCYIKCNNIESAHNLFDEMPERNSVSCNLLMSGYLHNGNVNKSLEVFKSVNFEEINEYIISTTLASCSEIRAYKKGIQLHSFAIKSGILQISHVRNSLIQMYSKCSCIKEAMDLFKILQSFDIYAFNSMLNGLTGQGYLIEAMDLVSDLVKEINKMDNVSYLAILGLCSNLKDLNLGVQIHCQIVKRSLNNDVFVNSSIIDMYGKCGLVKNASCAFFEMLNKNVVTWTSLMASYMQNELFEESLKFFLEMQKVGVKPNELTFAVALNCSAGLSNLRTGDALNSLVEKLGFKKCLSVGNALINTYSKSGSINNGHKVFDEMSVRDIVSWNSIIIGFVNHGHAKMALEAFNYMLSAFWVPNYVTFIGVLLACGQLGLVELGYDYLNNTMKEMGIKPGLEHYTCMVGIFCRAGLINEAYKFMQNTHINWDVVAWRSLLISCQVYKNYELGYKVANYILELNPKDVGTYVLISNMYAKINKWDAVLNMRKLMREKNVKKEPGLSWIQIGSKTHVFTSDDTKNPNFEEIKEKLNELMDRIKLIGYSPNLEMDLHDVGADQKEENLRYHSEKMAVAFGLIKSPNFAPIYVMKNLRICEDCHVAMKLISVVTKRNIVLRDNNKFHCIENGVCSCNDYW